METIEANVLGTIYRNTENGYSVISVRLGRTETTVVGNLPMLSPGEQVSFTGDWVEHPQYGRQLKCTHCQPIKPTTVLGIERYLGSGLIRGIGPTTAKAIVSCFGEETMTILSEHPERLKEVPGMGKKRWKQVAENFKEQQGAREAMIFLQSYGIPASLAVRISKLYGDRTPQVIRENPYRLCEDLEGVGFVTADRIGMALGVPADSEGRIRSALKYVLSDAAGGMGHCYLPKAELIGRASQLLRVEEAVADHMLTEMLLKRELVSNLHEEETRIWLPAFDGAEREVAQRLCELMYSLGAAPMPQSYERDIDLFEQRRHMRFSEKQREAIRSAMSHGVLVITGGPGTGKTTIINCILSLMKAEKNTVLLCAPTGRAAKRMTEATGEESKTIHRLLEYTGDEGCFAKNQDEPLEADCVIVDETSMVDLMLMRSLLRAIEPGTRLLLVGDADQLPSVGAGNVLGDILQSGVIPCVRLTDIYRQSETSRIVVNAHRINHGELPLLNEKGTDFFFERKENYRDAAQTIVRLVTERLPKFMHYPEEERLKQAAANIQVLAPARKGDCGVVTLNTLLQQVLNPDRQQGSISYGETVFRTGDKVMQTHNDYQLAWRRHCPDGWEEGVGVFNGDVGFVTEVDEDEHSLTVLFDDERECVYTSTQLENLDLAYCLSVHKSQGSEFPVVVMPVVGGPSMLLTRNLFYTALTRARTMVVLVGREDVIAQMVANDHILKRYTALAERLAAMPQNRG